MKRITTVRGDISPNVLGLTSMHEHTLNDMTVLHEYFKEFFPAALPEKLVFKLENFPYFKSGMVFLSEELAITDDVDYMIGEINAFKKVGGKTIVDGSPIGMRGNLNDIKKVSDITGVNIICATGLFPGMALPSEIMEKIKKGDKHIIPIFENEIKEGMDGTNIKPGFLKCALDKLTDDFTVDKNELAVFRSCAKVAANNGMSVQVHTANPLTPELILEAVDTVLSETGIDPGRLVILHTDQFMTSPSAIIDYVADINATKGLNTDFHEKLLDMGVNISFDTWGSPINTTFFSELQKPLPF